MSEGTLESTSISDEVSFIKVSGPLETDSFEEVQQTLGKVYQSGVHKIIIDFSDVSYVSSSVIGSIIEALQKTQEKGGGLVIVSSSKFILKTFDLVAGGLVPFVKNLDAAKRFFNISVN